MVTLGLQDHRHLTHPENQSKQRVLEVLEAQLDGRYLIQIIYACYLIYYAAVTRYEIKRYIVMFGDGIVYFFCLFFGGSRGLGYDCADLIRDSVR